MKGLCLSDFVYGHNRKILIFRFGHVIHHPFHGICHDIPPPCHTSSLRIHFIFLKNIFVIQKVFVYLEVYHDFPFLQDIS